MGNGNIQRDTVDVPRYDSFSIIPNTYLRDERVSLKARGLMTTMLYLPDSWDFSVVGLAKLIPDGESSIKTSMKELEQCGYIVKEQIRGSNGKFGRFIYHVIVEPESAKAYIQPTRKNRMSVGSEQMQNILPQCENHVSAKSVQNNKKSTKKPKILPQVEKPLAEKPTAENRRQINTKEINTNKSNIVGRSVGQTRTREELYNTINYINLYRSLNLSDRDMLNSIIDIMLETYNHSTERIKLGSKTYTKQQVVERLDSLTEDDMRSVIVYINDYDKKIINPYNFVLTLLLQCKRGQDPFWQNKVKRDMS